VPVDYQDTRRVTDDRSFSHGCLWSRLAVGRQDDHRGDDPADNREDHRHVLE
jgi:hypothetical protein